MNRKTKYRAPVGKPFTPAERRKMNDGWEVSQKTKGEPVAIKGKNRRK